MLINPLNPEFNGHLFGIVTNFYAYEHDGFTETRPFRYYLCVCVCVCVCGRTRAVSTILISWLSLTSYQNSLAVEI